MLYDVNEDHTVDKLDVLKLQEDLLAMPDKAVQHWKNDELKFQIRLVPYFTEDADQLSFYEKNRLVTEADEIIRSLTELKVTSTASLELDQVENLDYSRGMELLGKSIVVTVKNKFIQYDEKWSKWYSTIPRSTSILQSRLNFELNRHFTTAATETQWLSGSINYTYFYKDSQAEKTFYYNRFLIEIDVNTGKVRFVGSEEDGIDFPDLNYDDVYIIPQPTYGPPIAEDAQ
jgi:hypothetical protein